MKCPFRDPPRGSPPRHEIHIVLDPAITTTECIAVLQKRQIHLANINPVKGTYLFDQMRPSACLVRVCILRLQQRDSAETERLERGGQLDDKPKECSLHHDDMADVELLQFGKPNGLGLVGRRSMGLGLCRFVDDPLEHSFPGGDGPLNDRRLRRHIEAKPGKIGRKGQKPVKHDRTWILRVPRVYRGIGSQCEVESGKPRKNGFKWCLKTWRNVEGLVAEVPRLSVWFGANIDVDLRGVGIGRCQSRYHGREYLVGKCRM